MTSEEETNIKVSDAAKEMATLAEKQRKLRVKQLAPLRKVIDGDAYQSVIDGLTKLKGQFPDDNFIEVHITSLTDIMPRFKQHIANEPNDE